MPVLKDIHAFRNYIANHYEKLRRILSQKEFNGLFGGLQGERLTRAPKGFPPDHPAIDLLRYKQFLVYVTRPPALAETPKLLPTIVQIFRAVMPLVRFLNASFDGLTT